MPIVFLLVAVSAGASFVLTGVVRAFALRHEVLDRPNTRSSHSVPMPRGGGVGVLLASAVGMAMGVGFGVVQRGEAFTLGCGMLLLGALGWADDTRGVRPGVRLAVQVIIAVWTVYVFGGLPVIRLGDISLTVGAAGYVLATLGTVWSINLFNFMDGIDGLAGSQAVLIFGVSAVLFLTAGDASLATISAILAAASGGFLAWNWPPAKIFLGDVGSGPIGYLIAGLALASERNQSVSLFTFVILGGVFICDATVTLVRRFIRGDRPAQAHRDHAYQRLARAWGSHQAVTAWAAAVTSLLALLGALVALKPQLVLPILLVATFLLGGLMFAAERRAPM